VVSFVAGLEALLSLRLQVGAFVLEPLRRGERETTVVRVEGDGVDGFGEDVSHDLPDRSTFRRLDLPALHVRGRLREALGRLDEVDLRQGVSHGVVVNYRRWAIESALIDLALRQNDLALADVLGGEPRPVRFVVSPRTRDADAVLAFSERVPSLRLKLDPRSSWTRVKIEQIAALGTVDVLDLKGTYPGTSVYQPPDARLYRDLVEAFPTAWLEDPAIVEMTRAVLGRANERIAWDEPLHDVDDLECLRPAGAVNVKPSRLGSLASLLAIVARCRELGIVVYGGGQSEIGPGRAQIQLLAALFYPDGPNDVAPIGYDDLSAPVISSQPLTVAPAQVGFC
jgi:L-alanine-DL-glutamate epimerase-like enolase superfamily enzyme